MRLFLASVIGLALLTGCASQTDQSRSEAEAGGAIPWNRPAQWEGPGVLGSQLGQYNQ